MSWSVSAVVPAFSAPIFETEIAPMTTSARIIAPNAMPRRYASRRLLKRDIRFLPGKQGGSGGAGRGVPARVAPVIARSRAGLSAQATVQVHRNGKRARPRPDDPDGAAGTTG